MVLVGGTESRLFGERLGASIDETATNGRVFGPGGDQAPDEEIGPVGGIIRQDEHGRGGGNVIAWSNLCREAEFREGFLHNGRVNG